MVSYGARTVVMNTVDEVLILVVVDDGLVHDVLDDIYSDMQAS